MNKGNEKGSSIEEQGRVVGVRSPGHRAGTKPSRSTPQENRENLQLLSDHWLICIITDPLLADFQGICFLKALIAQPGKAMQSLKLKGSR